jgi:hypothetical protein
VAAASGGVHSDPVEKLREGRIDGRVEGRKEGRKGKDR